MLPQKTIDMEQSATHLRRMLCCAFFFFVLTADITVCAQQDNAAEHLERGKVRLTEGVLTDPRQLQMPEGPPIYQINAGGSEAPDSWESDSWRHPSPYLSPIPYRTANGTDWWLFFTEKSRVSYSDMEWDFPVDNGNYIVDLYFAESPNTSQTIGSRVFDVDIEGKKALDDFDILNYVGSNFPAELSFGVVVSDNNLDIDFHVEKGTALISAIVITPGTVHNYPQLAQTSLTLVKTMQEGTELRIPIRATDYDSPASAIHISGDAEEPLDFFSVVDYGNGNGEMILRPDYDDAGNHLLAIEAGDEEGTDTGCGGCWFYVNLTVLNTPENTVIYRVNAGDWQPVDDAPVAWMEDSYLHPSPYITFGSYSTQAHYITTNATDAPDAIFNRSRVCGNAAIIWDFPVANGNYTIDFYFAETYFDLSGSRIFDVLVEGEPKLVNLDIFSEAGRNTPLQKTVTSQVTDGNLTIFFKRKLGNPMVAGIAITYNGEIDATSSPELEAISSVAANDQLIPKITVYPNPVENYLHLSFADAVHGPVTVRLIDSNNQERYRAVNEGDVSRTEAMFALDPGLPSGVYVAEVVANNYKQFIKVLKK